MAALALAYLTRVVGIIGGDRSGFSAFGGIPIIGEYQGTVPLFLLKIWIYVRGLFVADWISWPVLLWFAVMLLLIWKKRDGWVASGQARQLNHGKPRLENLAGDDLQVMTTGKIVLLGALFTLFSAVLSVQSIWMNPSEFPDLRYYMGALPLLLAMKGMFAEWTWRKSRTAGIAVVAALLFTSVGAAPFNMTNILTGGRTLGPHFFQFVREIHRPYRDSVREVSDYLLKHAKQDDLVYVPFFGDREALMVSIGHHVRFCCVLGENSPLPRGKIEALDSSLYVKGSSPEWIVFFGRLTNESWQLVKANYTVATTLDVHSYPTHRPEISFHAFTPIPVKNGVYILRRR